MSRLRGGGGRFPAVLLALALTGCGGLLPDPPKRTLYRIDPVFASPAHLPQVPIQLLIAVPVAPAGLDTSRIAVSPAPLSLDYFAGVEWADRAPLMVQSTLIDAFEKSRTVGAVARDSAAFRADFVLETAIRDFQAAYETPNAPPRVAVSIDAKLVKIPERKIVGQTTLTGDAAAAANEVPAVVRAFGEALGRASSAAVAWTVTNPGLSQRRASLH